MLTRRDAAAAVNQRPFNNLLRRLNPGDFALIEPNLAPVEAAAGDLLYSTLAQFGFAQGEYQARPDDGLCLVDCRITNAVRCVPPENKPTPDEIATCRQFLAATIAHMPRLSAVLALGRIAHDSVVVALGARRLAYPFAHGGEHEIGTLKLVDSYHCSRLNTNTGVLTPKMFGDVIAKIRAQLDAQTRALA